LYKQILNIPAGAIATVATLACVGHTRTELKKNYSQMNIDHNWRTMCADIAKSIVCRIVKNVLSSPKSLKHSLDIIKARTGYYKLIHLIIHGVKPTMFKGLENGPFKSQKI
jgi:hypothetical protein